MSTKQIPVFGTMEEFAADQLKFLERARDAGEIVKLFADSPDFPYVISSPELVREVLVEKVDSIHKNLDTLKPLVGEGLVTSNGERHRYLRKIVAPLFTPRIVNKYAPDMVRITQDRIDTWVEGETRNINQEMVAITLDVIITTMCGVSIWDISEEEDLRTHLSPITRLIEENVRQQGREPMEATQERLNRLMGHIAELDKMVYALIERRQANLSADRYDMLSILLNTDLTEKEVRDQVMTLFFAGHETTMQTLCWALYCISQHPEVERKFHEELDRVLDGRTPTADDLANLTYLHNILLEALRCYPPNWSNGRIVVEDVEIGGFPLKKGELLLFSQWAIHRDPRWFDQADAFLPERWEGDLAKRIPAYAYFPFGGGMRGCTSKDFAMMEAMLVLTLIGQNYRVTLPPGTPNRPEPGNTLSPETLYMKIEKR